MRILHIIWHLGQGGAQTYLLNLLKLQVADPDIQVELLVFEDRTELSEEFESLVAVNYLHIMNGRNPLDFFKIVSALKSSTYDLIHSHSNALLLNMALQFVGQPVVFTEHGGKLLGGRWVDQLAYKLFARRFNVIIAISNEMARLMRATVPSLADRVEVVYNGVDIERIQTARSCAVQDYWPNSEMQPFTIGVIGRLDDQKGIDLFIDTAKELCKRRSDAQFVIVGDGSLRAQLEQQARSLVDNNKLFFTGYRSDALSILKTMDVFLFTSKYEPFGLVITEAMVALVPVVAANIKGAVPELIDNGKTGLVVEGANIPELAESVDRLLDNERLRSEVKSKAFAAVSERFTMEANHVGVKNCCLRALG